MFGGKIVRAPSLMHGKTSPIIHDGKTIFSGLPQGFPATRYHSLIVTDIPSVSRSQRGNDRMESSWDCVIGSIPSKESSFIRNPSLTVVGKQLLTNFVRR